MAKVNVYELVTERIIVELEKGIIPWNRPWFGSPDGAFSRSTGKPYSFINQMLLGKPGEYLTFTQIKDAGGKVKKGETANVVVFFKPYLITEKNDKGEEEKKSIPILRYYNVFHIDQTEGIEPKYEKAVTNDLEPVEEAENIIQSYLQREKELEFENVKGNKACYNPTLDKVIVPEIHQFDAIEEYYSTAFHELTHSTMKESRCNREQDRKEKCVSFGSQEYSKEELVAELGASALVNHAGLESSKSFKNSAGYIQNWLQILRNDTKFIVSASSKAEKAVNYILGVEA
ncbi:MAG: zincin-like metallopeptidase domain-containing protein [Lachnospiraceae bacterium]|nr:zincin-like metallopeptidase domain-containing protein [Lachnospiraceae bacterium]